MATNARPVGDLTRVIAAHIRVMRARIPMRQDELAAAAKIPVDTLSKIERELAAIDMEQLARIAEAFSLTPDEFIGEALRAAKWHKGGRPSQHRAAPTQRKSNPTPGRDVSSKSDGNGNPAHQEGWEIRPPSEEMLEILRADAEENPDA